MYKITKTCRVCKKPNLTDLFSLGDQVLTGVFPASEGQQVSRGPVDLVKCTSPDGCGLVQLKQSYDVAEMYGSNYGYRSGLNPSMVAHLQSRVRSILALNILNKGDLIVDIGSNDATTLSAYEKNNFKLVGIDPTGLKFSEFYSADISLIADFFTSEKLLNFSNGKKAKVITSFSMFYDLEDPVIFAKEIEASLDDDGIWVFEQSYLPSMLLTNSFDTVCHEHLEFYALEQIEWICRDAGLKIVDVELNDINGGSFCVTASKIGSQINTCRQNVRTLFESEASLDLNNPKHFVDFREHSEHVRDSLLGFLRSAKKSGQLVCGLGASTKGNVLLQYCGIDKELLPMIGEVNEDKFGCFTPGSLIPLVSEEEVLSRNPDYLLILPWHFRLFFLNLPKLKGRKLVFPLPTLEVVQL